MARIIPLALSLALLTAPAYAANTLAFDCRGMVEDARGTAYNYDARVLLDFDQGTVSGLSLLEVNPSVSPTSVLRITEVADTYVTFSGIVRAGKHDLPTFRRDWVGRFDRYTGVLTAVLSGSSGAAIWSYALTCKPLKPLF